MNGTANYDGAVTTVELETLTCQSMYVYVYVFATVNGVQCLVYEWLFF